MSKIFQRKNIILITIILLIVFISYFFFFKNKSINCSGEEANWITGAESVPEYLDFTKNLEKLTNYLGCKCADNPFCYSCRYNSNESDYIYYYNNKFIVPPYEYTIEDQNIKKQNLSINKKGDYFLFSTAPINLRYIYNSFQEGKNMKIASNDGTQVIEIDEIISTNLGGVLKKKLDEDIITLEFKTKTGKIYKIKTGHNKRKSIDSWLCDVYVYRDGMDYSKYRIDYIMDKIYFNGRKKVLKNLNTIDKFENQLFDIYLKTNRTVPNDNRDFILKKDSSIQDIYKIMEKDKSSEKDGVFVYRGNFLVGEFGGEYYSIRKYSFEGEDKGLYCENSWAIGGGGDTNSKCKIPANAIRADEYIELMKEKCNK